MTMKICVVLCTYINIVFMCSIVHNAERENWFSNFFVVYPESSISKDPEMCFFSQILYRISFKFIIFTMIIDNIFCLLKKKKKTHTKQHVD